MDERLCFHRHDFSISAEQISAPCDGIGGAVKTTYRQEKSPKAFE